MVKGMDLVAGVVDDRAGDLGSQGFGPDARGQADIRRIHVIAPVGLIARPIALQNPEIGQDVELDAGVSRRGADDARHPDVEFILHGQDAADGVFAAEVFFGRRLRQDDRVGLDQARRIDSRPQRGWRRRRRPRDRPGRTRFP